MTTIAYRNGILAADSRCTYDTEAGGTRVFLCEKLFRKTITHPDGHQEEVVLATAGESYSGMVFLDWYGSGKEVPETLIHGDADFTVLILKKDGLYEVDKWCRPIKVLDEFYAVGSGTKAALGAMHMGASAVKAVEIACKVEPYSAPPITTMRLLNGKAKVPKVRKVDGKGRQDAGRKDPMGLPKVGNPGPSDPLLQHDKPLSHVSAGPRRADTDGSATLVPGTAAFDQAVHNHLGSKRDTGSRPLLEVADRVQRASES